MTYLLYGMFSWPVVKETTSDYFAVPAIYTENIKYIPFRTNFLNNREIFGPTLKICSTGRPAMCAHPTCQKQHQQVTSVVTRVLVGQAQLYHCKLPQSKVTQN